MVSLFPLPERSDRPSRTNLIFVAKPLFLLLDKRVVRSAITLVGLRNCGNCPDDRGMIVIVIKGWISCVISLGLRSAHDWFAKPPQIIDRNKRSA